MTTRIAINGFGRIGRLVLRAAMESGRKDLEFVAINDLGSVEANAHLFKYDSTHGVYTGDVSSGEGWMDVGAGKIKTFAERDPAQLPWGDLDIDIVFECTGIFADKEKASAHLTAGAKRVLVSAPCKDADLTVVYGINHDAIRADHRVLSNASCTTNCLAPVAKVLHDTVGLEHGYMTTIHAYTGDQCLVDGLHKDMRRARAATQSIVPTTTGAARAVGLVLPELAGRLDGTSLRIPTPNVSVVDLTFTAARDTTIEEINAALSDATEGPLEGVLTTNKAPLVSCDFNHNPSSSVVDLAETQVIGSRLVRVMSWYDNEWGFSNRMLDTASVIGERLREVESRTNLEAV